MSVDVWGEIADLHRGYLLERAVRWDTDLDRLGECLPVDAPPPSEPPPT